MWSVSCPYREALLLQVQFGEPRDWPRRLPREVVLGLNALRL